MNEMHADFCMRKSNDFSSSEMDISSGGVSYPIYKKTTTITTRKKLTRKKPMAVKKPLQGLELRSVGFSLLYSENSSDPSQDVQIKRINLETPCKIIMAILLIFHFTSEYNFPSMLEKPLNTFRDYCVETFALQRLPLLNKFCGQEIAASVVAPEYVHVDNMTEVRNKINTLMQNLISVLGRGITVPAVPDEKGNVSVSVMEKMKDAVGKLRRRCM